MSGMRRKDRLKNQQRIEARRERNAERLEKEKARVKALTDAQNAYLATLPVEEQQTLAAIAKFTGGYRFAFPKSDFFDANGISDIDQRRVLYVLTSMGIFSELEVGDYSHVTFQWWEISGLCMEIGLSGDSSQFARILDSLSAAIKGLRYCCAYAGVKEEEDGTPFLFHVLSNYGSYQLEYPSNDDNDQPEETAVEESGS